MLSKNSSISRRNASRRLSSKSGNRLTDRLARSAATATFSHWPVKFSISASRLRIGEHAPHLLLEHRRILAACPAAASVDQLVVRDAAPQEERQPRRQLEIADAIALAGRQRWPARSRRGRRIPDRPGCAAAPLRCRRRRCRLRSRPLLIELHQRFDVGRRGRTAEGVLGQRGDDRARAGGFLARRWPGGRRKSCGGSACRWRPCALYGPSIHTWPTCG